MNTDAYLSCKGAAQYIGKSRSLIHKLRKAGRIPAVRTPIGYLYRRKDLDQYLQTRRKPGRPFGPAL